MHYLLYALCSQNFIFFFHKNFELTLGKIWVNETVNLSFVILKK